SASLLQDPCALGWTGRIAALLDLASLHVRRLGRTAQSPEESPGYALRGGDYDGGRSLFRDPGEFRRQPILRTFAGPCRRQCHGIPSARWQWLESLSAVSLDGDPSSHTLSGIRRLCGPLRLRHGFAHHAAIG